MSCNKCSDIETIITFSVEGTLDEWSNKPVKVKTKYEGNTVIELPNDEKTKIEDIVYNTTNSSDKEINCSILKGLDRIKADNNLPNDSKEKIKVKIKELCDKIPEESTEEEPETNDSNSETQPSLQDILDSVFDDEKKYCGDTTKYVRFKIKTGEGVEYETCLFPSKYARNEKVNPFAFYTFRTGLPSGYSKDCYDVVNLREKKYSNYGRAYPVTNTYVRFIKGSKCVESSKVDTSRPVPIDLSGEGFKVPRRDTGNTDVRRLGGQQSTISTVKPKEGLGTVLDEPKLTNDEKYILDLFKNE